MPSFTLDVVATYRPEDVGTVLPILTEWASSGDGRNVEVDHEIDPVRVTQTATYVIEAPDEETAKLAAVQAFGRDSFDLGLAGPESTLAHVAPA